MKKTIFKLMIFLTLGIGLLSLSAMSAMASESGAATLQAATMMEALDKVNVRVSPDTESEVLGQLEQGEKLFAVELTEEGWYRVVYQGETGYVRSDFLKIFGEEDWDTSEGTGEEGLSGEVIDPEEEVKKASEEAARKESEAAERAAAGEASSAAASEKKAQEEEAQKTRSRNTTIGIFVGAVLLIVVYAIYTVIKEMKNPEGDVERPNEDEGAQKERLDTTQKERIAGKVHGRNRQKDAEGAGNQTEEALQKNMEQETDMEFLDLDL